MISEVSIQQRSISNVYIRVAIFHKLCQSYYIADDVMDFELENIVKLWDTVPTDVIIQIEQERNPWHHEASYSTEMRFNYLCVKHHVPLSFEPYFARHACTNRGETLRMYDIYPVTNPFVIIDRFYHPELES